MSPGKKRQSASRAEKSPARSARGGTRQTKRSEDASAKKTSKSSSKKNSKKASSKGRVSKSAATKKPAKRSPASAGGASKKSTAKKTSAKKSSAPESTVKKTAGKKAVPKTSPTKKTPAKRAATTSSRRPAARPALSEKRLATVQKRLEKMRSELERQIADIDLETFRGTQSDLSGEVALSEDFADAGTATFDRERDLSLQNNSRDIVAQINKALMRIGDGSYGTCERCGRSITAARLQTLPHVSLCQDCKRREERVR